MEEEPGSASLAEPGVARRWRPLTGERVVIWTIIVIACASVLIIVATLTGLRVTYPPEELAKQSQRNRQEILQNRQFNRSQFCHLARAIKRMENACRSTGAKS